MGSVQWSTGFDTGRSPKPRRTVKIDTQNLMDELVKQTIDSVSRNENLNTDGNYEDKLRIASQRSKQHLKKSKTNLEQYLAILDQDRQLVSIEDFKDFDIPLKRETVISLIGSIDDIMLEMLSDE